MSNSYVLLEKVVVPAAGASSVTFANIPQTGYTDLLIKMSVRSDQANNANSIGISFNGSSANFTSKFIEGSGSSAASFNSTAIIGNAQGTSSTSNTFSSLDLYIPNYAGSTNKSYSADGVTENNGTTAYATIAAGLWSQTAAITSVGISITNFVANSTFYLYGVAKLGTTPTIAPKATGGDVIMTDGTYWYHAFRASGTFTPAVELSCDALVVAGGGGAAAGGAGAGGLKYQTALSAPAASYTVTVGAGGAGQKSTAGPTPSQGGNSSIGTLITSTGGGNGAVYGNAGGAGGSGGGAANNSTGGAASPSGQGNVGGYNVTVDMNYGSGGGAGAAGNIGDLNVRAVGGIGLAYATFAAATSTGDSNYYAGGGGGGNDQFTSGTGPAGGLGGGGKGADTRTTPGSNGGTNTGGGGGGGGSSTTGGQFGGNGGSGIVIIRYPIA